MSATNRKKGGATKKEAQSQAKNAFRVETGSIDKVRDILFGEQMRSFSEGVTRLEKRMEKEVVALKAETGKRFESLERYVKKEIEALITRIKSEQDGRNASTKEIGKELDHLNKSLETKIGRLGESSTDAQRDLRKQILDQSKTLQNDLQKKYEEISNLLEKETGELRASKADRSSLAILLTELAVRLDAGLAEKLNIKSGDLSGD